MSEAQRLTEQEWLTTSHTWRMLHVVRRSRASDRKARLLNVALCQLFWDHLPEAAQAILAESEALADGLASVTPDELCWRANDLVPALDPDGKSGIAREAAKAVCYAVLPRELFAPAETCQRIAPNDQIPPSLIRDIFGNPFRPASLNPAWQTPTVVALGQAAYDSRTLPGSTLDGARLAVLADALEEAGCDNANVLNHLRSPGPHVRGCFALDLVLGKE